MMTPPKENLIYLIELTVNKNIKKKYKFSSFEEACLFLYKDIKKTVQNLADSQSAYYNACLFLTTNSQKQLLVRKNLCKVYF
jgi:hypothetical protein